VGNFINISILIPLMPMGMSLLLLILLVSFNRTINRLTKPVSVLVVFSLLTSALICSYFYFKKIEGEVFLSKYLNLFESTNLILHLNLLTEKIVIFFALTMAIIITFLFYKLPRRKGYVSLMIGISLISSSIMLGLMCLDFSLLI